MTDDNVDAAEALELLLIALGHNVLTAHDGPSALKAALDFHPDVVLLDIGLPGMDGYAVARAIRQKAILKDAVLIAVTGYGQEADRQRAKEAGFDHFLMKPPDYNLLKGILATVS